MLYHADSRYVYGMKNFYFLVTGFFYFIAVQAQPNGGLRPDGLPISSLQASMTLRDTVKSASSTDQKIQPGAMPETAEKKRLSTQERAHLRAQLRAQRLESKQTSP
jgi:hypothetical protein